MSGPASGKGGKDLTQGPIASTLLLFAVPTLASNVLQSLNGSINAIWVGRFLGAQALAATANANIIMFLMFSVVFGFGMLAGNLLGGWAADISLKTAAVGLLAWSAVFLAAFAFAASNIWLISLVCFAIGMGGGLGPILQVRLMDVAGEAQTMAAALHHAAFNLANALGPWLAGLAITAGLGWTAPGWVGFGLALGGIAILLVAFSLERRGSRRASGRDAIAPS